MKFIELGGKRGAGKRAIVDDWFKIPESSYVLGARRPCRGYAGGLRYLVQDVWEQAGRELPGRGSSLGIVHVKGDVLDCRLENLELRSASQLGHAAKPTTASSGCRGVYDIGKYWQARIGKRTRSKTFPKTDAGKLAAARQYDAWAVELFGDAAVLNFPNNGAKK